MDMINVVNDVPIPQQDVKQCGKCKKHINTNDFGKDLRYCKSCKAAQRREERARKKALTQIIDLSSNNNKPSSHDVYSALYQSIGAACKKLNKNHTDGVAIYSQFVSLLPIEYFNNNLLNV